jgi:hypothetical protein
MVLATFWAVFEQTHLVTLPFFPAKTFFLNLCIYPRFLESQAGLPDFSLSKHSKWGKFTK